MSEDKIIARRQKIFNALDEMKEKQEKISAQKLAAIVNMGKQTVLPVYREWLEMENISEAEKIDLPERLLHAIKREFAKEKFRLAEHAQLLEEDICDKDDRLKQLDKELTLQKNNIQSLKETLSGNAKDLDQQQALIHKLEKKLESEVATIAELRNQITQSEKDKREALKDQEAQLDKSHQQLLNHWIKATDTERQEKTILSRQLDKLKMKEVEFNKRISSLEYERKQLSTETKTLQKSCDSYKANSRILEQKASNLKQLISMLGEPITPETRIIQLLEVEKEASMLASKNKELASELNEINEMIDNNKNQEKEIIKLKAYIEGLKDMQKSS